MIQELADKVWSNPRFQRSAKAIEKAWLMRELKLTDGPNISEVVAAKAMSSAAILASSENLQHRVAALRLSTYVYETFADSNLPFDAALRVVLARLGNFPSFVTRDAVNTALSTLPLSLAVDEMLEASKRTVVFGGEAITLTNFQRRLWLDLTEQKSVALSAPTSGGKSFVLELYLASQFRTASRLVVYVVPTRALISQVADELGRIFTKRRLITPEIVTVPLDAEFEVPSRAIFVMTQERLHLSLQSHHQLRPDVIVIDEAHSISEGARGILLQSVIEEMLLRNPEAQILFASPTTKNLDAFGRIFLRADISPRPSMEPTVSQNFMALEIKARGRIVITAARDSGRTAALGELSTDVSLRSRIEKLARIPTIFCANQSNLIYANGADEAEEIALLISKDIQSERQNPRLNALARLARESVHPKYVLAQCVEKGVGFHYANIPTKLRQEIEAAFSRGELKYLVCTSTLLQGVNLPAKNLFLMKPTRGQGIPLEPQDFWNLAGRAGRMMREFQGNIFLIDYGQWPTRPLSGPKDVDIEPAIEKSVKYSTALLKGVINAKSLRISASKRIELETAFVRLFADFKNDKLEETFQRLNLDDEDKASIQEELRQASERISLPVRILSKTHNVSAHRQQRLFQRIIERIRQDPKDIASLIPLPPTDRQAFKSYADILELCHEIILGIDTSRGLHRFHALLAKRWMSGWSVPRIVNAAIKKKRDEEAKKDIELRREIDTRKIIREILQVLEEAIRFQTIRLFGCYRTLLEYALIESGASDLTGQIPDVELFLEIGASNKTMVSLISLGLSRAAAIKLNGARSEIEPELNRDEALIWLQSQENQLGSLGLSALQIAEVTELLARLTSSSEDH